MAAPPTTVSSYVKRFEARGHVRREPNPTDRRSYRIRLTPAGQHAHRAAAALFTPTLQQALDVLGGDDSDIHHARHRLRAALDQVRHAKRQ